MPESSRRSFIKNTAIAGLTAGLVTDALASEGATQTGLTFLFQGDSITDGNRGRDQNDLNHVMGHGYASNIAARIGADFPHNGFHFYNRGISGNTVADLKAGGKKMPSMLNQMY